MKIVYIHQHFCTPEGSSGTRSYDVSQHLARMGHEVTVICGVFDVGGIKKPPWYKPFKKLRMGGFDVIVCNAYHSNYQNRFARMRSFVWFAFLATIATLTVTRPDLVFATSLPLTVGIPGFITARLQQIPFIFEVRDIYPETDIIAGYLRKGSIIERLLTLLEWFMYIKADQILLVSPGFQKRLIERGYDGKKMRTVLLGADGEIFKNLRPNERFRKNYGLEGKTLAVYTGSHGTANGLDYVLDAAELLQKQDAIVFILIGDGREKPRLKLRAERMGLKNVRFVDSVSKTELPGLLAACNIGLMILRYIGPRPVTPNKIFDYMFAALPTIVNFRGATIEMVEADQTGIFADPTKPEVLAEKILYWAEHPKEARQIGERARKIAYQKYERRHIAEQIAEAFKETIQRKYG